MMPSKKNRVATKSSPEDSVVFNLGELAELEESRLEQEAEERVRARLESANEERRARERAATEIKRAEERSALDAQLRRLDEDVDRVRKQEELLARAHDALSRELDGLRGHQIALGERVLETPAGASSARATVPLWLALAVAVVSASVSGFTAARFADLSEEVAIVNTRARLIDGRLDSVERSVSTALRASEVDGQTGADPLSASSDRPTSLDGDEGARPASHSGPSTTSRPERPVTSPMDRLLDFDNCESNDPLCGSH